MKPMESKQTSNAEQSPGSLERPGSADSPDFRSELCALLNKHSMENGSNTPDFILNQFLADVLMCFNKAVRRRAQWYGHETAPCDNPPNNTICDTGHTA